MASCCHYNKKRFVLADLSLQKYNLLLTWGVFSNECFTTVSVTQGLSKVNTLPQSVSWLGPSDGILYRGQLTFSCQQGRRRDWQWHQISTPVSQWRKSVIAGGGFAQSIQSDQIYAVAAHSSCLSVHTPFWICWFDSRWRQQCACLCTLEVLLRVRHVVVERV